MAFTAMVEPMRAANGLAGQRLYSWGTVGLETGPIEASNGLSVTADHSVADAPQADRIVVCSGGNADRLEADAATSWIRRNLSRGVMLGAVADGAFLLARAGLLDGYACTLHWTSQQAFGEAFPHIDLKRVLFVIDRTRFTSAGGVGGFDMMLELIERDHGVELANGVAEWFVHRRQAAPSERNDLPLQLRTGVRDMVILSAIGIMEAELEDKVSLTRIAQRLSISPDRLERGFKRETGRTPRRYLRDLKVTRATDLLSHSNLSVREVALSCGFSDVSAFGRMIRRATGQTPSALRQRARQPNE
jgi:transcriptional regulator GlxA family with amidase domain